MATIYLTRSTSQSVLADPAKGCAAQVHRRTAMQGRDEGLVSPLNNDGRPWEQDSATEAWPKLVAETSLPDDLYSTELEHSRLAGFAGVIWEKIKDIVGHSTKKRPRPTGPG